MTPFSIRSLLIAVIFISNCITWTASRHHYTHNVSGHRSRHRRQGAGLYLPASYVIPGGEGSGAWGDWGTPSPCSRTCGGGVASQKRICIEFEPDGTPRCRGGDTKYFSCQTQDCPDGSQDFRAQQCAEHDSETFRGVRYNWVPYTKAPNPCELNCMPRAERFYYRHSAKVVDGTRCNDETFDVCVNGTCQPVGCDMMLGSDAREDKCRECRGNNTNCQTITGNISPTHELRKGYNDILLIPQGATSIVIEEVRNSNNYLALRSSRDNVYYLNGEYHIDFPRTLTIAGTLWHYERSAQGFAAPDKLRCQGPTNEPLYLSLLLQDENVGIDYEYSIPKDQAPPPNQQYNWVHGDFSPCSATCGGGFQTREVTCRSREELDVVDDSLCDGGLKPPTNQTCNTQSCAARWVEGAWSPCTKPCGQGGTRSRQVHCEKIITNGYPSIVADKECFELLGEKPPLFQECNKDSACPLWYTGPWKPCDKLCGEGKQTRQVVCYQKDDKGRIEVLTDEACEDEKPETEKPCSLHPCDGVDWAFSDWSGCDSCGSKFRSRTAKCVTKGQVVVNDSVCAYHPTPTLQEKCDPDKLPPCEVQWYAMQWSNCSVQCGKGVHTRRVFCGRLNNSMIEEVEASLCNAAEKYNDTKPCEIPPEKCPAKWYAGPWSACTKECGGGEQYRKVMCLIGNEKSNACDGDTYPDSTQTCNKIECNEDGLIPVDSSSTPIIDGEDEDCVEVEPEEGEELDELDEETGTTPDDMMFSDSPMTDEGSGAFTETEFTDETGSGSEPTITESSFTESSGSEPTESTETGDTETTESGASDGSTTETSETSATESTVSEASSETGETEGTTESSGTSESSATEESSGTSETESSTLESEATESSTLGSDVTESTDLSSTTEAIETTETTESSSDSSDASTTEYTITTEDTSTDASSTTESGTSESDTTEGSTTADYSTTESGSTESSSDVTESGSTDETTEFGTTETGESEGSTTESGSESPGSTETEVTESTVSGETTESGPSTESGATTESGETTETGGTTESGATEETDATETTETGVTESTITDLTGSTETEETGSTVEGTSETSEETTEWSWSSTIDMFTTTKKPKVCTPKCIKTQFGCCPDKITAAAGPFDEGCPNPKTCKESKHGCCPDGVSPATGPKDKGCPVVPCKETLFGCCKSDNKTAAEGNDQEGCPPPPPACRSSKHGCCKDGKTQAKGPNRKGCPEKKPKHPKNCEESEFGCCFDNKTKATGPNMEGCPCDVTEFGCCPDGVSPAHGTQMEGCVMSCNMSAYGCCSDGETPAHGPDGEGCCLLYRYGCCPDNYKPAEGPHLEGCGCQYAHFGCCPDNVTIARGPNKEGCGCQYTQFGCCPDRHTEATGENYDGCGCHTYQFGCCPDGTTIAKGPNLQGCHCQQSKFGCCGDGQTAATGPNQAGCDCSSSKYGCCPDGQTEAKGEKFLGCTDVPENRQAACSLSTDRGPCRNYTVYWYYDMEYGGCSRFWYGGCEGNGNRFSSKEECEDVCVQPSPKDACKLPKVKGACQGYILRWYFDSVREQCGQFVFGGCLGNANNFESRELCQEHCEPARSDDQCKLPLERGSCAGNFGRWGFNSETRRCEQFIWGGCEGNGNRFGSEAACILRCNPPGALQPECSEPQAVGNCTEKQAAWSFSQTENRCVPFYYTGCNGNGNRFITEESCTEACPSAFVQDVCTLAAVTGECSDYRERWYYDTAQQRCRQFYYGGCGGNGNNFATEQDCANRCREEPKLTTPAPTQEPQPFNQESCFLEKDPGPCSGSETRWAYDATLGACTTFQYGGCSGNQNNFPSEELCTSYCVQTQDICQLPMQTGPCYASMMRYFYDASTDSCSQFTYGGCQGNGNNFETLEDCERRCRTSQPQVTPTPERLPPQCYVSPTLEECAGEGEVWYYDQDRRECTVHQNIAAGPYCRRTGVFPSEEACQRDCGVFRDLDVCRHPVDPGPCRAAIRKVYFDESTGRCEAFLYGGCHGGPNRFSSVAECEQVCKPETDPCKQRPEQGNCVGYEIKWFFDEARDVCRQFVYTGCDGNDNRFDSQAECEGLCKKQPPIDTTTTTAAPPRPSVDEQCRTPASLSPCGEEQTVFYYDEATSSCKAASFGGCRYANSYRTEEECERQCGAFRGLDACSSPLDPGSCRAAIPKVYFDSVTGTCQQYAYGGCHGGPNRFSTVEECEQVCSHLIRENANCDSYIEECRTISCPYSVQRRRTADGCERCSCVPVEVDCEPLKQECARLKCTYGMESSAGEDGCERCRCIDHPCASKECPSGQRCVATAYRDPLTQEPRYASDCRTMNKPGTCPADVVTESGQCRRECNDDADCRGVGKCCGVGCSQLCLEPSTPTSPAPHIPTTHGPELPQAPSVITSTEPEVTSQEGGKATLRCLFHGNPPPKITWRRGEITIDGTVGRYRLLSDGALEIVSLYRNDSGVYICVADNGLGTARQEIHLQVNDPVEGPAGISGDPNMVVTGEMDRGLRLRCLAYGYPEPSIYWYRGISGPMVPFSSSLYEARGNYLHIRTLNFETLGEYACMAYNGIGKPASWSVIVQAYRPDESWSDNQYLVDRDRQVIVTPRQPQTEPTTPPPEIEVPVYRVPVSTRIMMEPTSLSPGAELSIPCEVDGYPTPDVFWTKDNSRLSANERMQITEARLTIQNVNEQDSGMYGCHAANAFSSHSSTLQINVLPPQSTYVPDRCTDNPFFADCKLIVRSKFCQHKYYSKFCCKSCVLAGQLNAAELDMQADESWRKKK